MSRRRHQCRCRIRQYKFRTLSAARTVCLPHLHLRGTGCHIMIRVALELRESRVNQVAAVTQLHSNVGTLQFPRILLHRNNASTKFEVTLQLNASSEITPGCKLADLIWQFHGQLGFAAKIKRLIGQLIFRAHAAGRPPSKHLSL